MAVVSNIIASMGIMAPIARMIVREHLREAITGEVLLVGRQTVPLTPAEAIEPLASEGVEALHTSPEIDEDTRSALGHEWITEKSFFSMFTDSDIVTLDVDGYENADIVHDLQYPLPPSWRERFDFVWNGSCLDNIWNASAALIHSCDLLKKPGGRIFAMEMANQHFRPYSMLSPGWFFDYFAVNSFGAIKVQALAFHEGHLWTGPYDFYVPGSLEAASYAPPETYFGRRALLSVAIAQTSFDTSTDKFPIQHQYRSRHDIYRRAAERLLGTSHEGSAEAPLREGWIYKGTLPGVDERGLKIYGRLRAPALRSIGDMRSFLGRSSAVRSAYGFIRAIRN